MIAASATPGSPVFACSAIESVMASTSDSPASAATA
jgi:hypothetical protein